MDCEPVMVGSVSHQFSAGADLSSTHAEYRRGSNYYRWGVTQSVMQSDYGEFSQNRLLHDALEGGHVRGRL